jgi:centromeric protein E
VHFIIILKITESQLDFVDLAGCEKMNVHDQVSSSKKQLDFGSAKKDRMKETQHINKSLFFLTQVIS